MEHKIKQKSGFTLIELLVVISIIGILSSVVLSSLTTAKDKAKLARYKSDLHQAELFLEMYNIEYGGYPYGSSGGLYCIAESSAPACLIGGSTISTKIGSIGGGTVSFFFEQSLTSQLAAIAAPKLKNDITLGNGLGQYRGIVYQSCSSPTTVNGVSVCPVQNVSDLGNPKVIYPVLESSSVVIKAKVAGTNSPENYSAGSQ